MNPIYIIVYIKFYLLFADKVDRPSNPHPKKEMDPQI